MNDSSEFIFIFIVMYGILVIFFIGIMLFMFAIKNKLDRDAKSRIDSHGELMKKIKETNEIFQQLKNGE